MVEAIGRSGGLRSNKSLPYLVKQLLASGVGLNGKFQLCVHGGHTHIDLGWDQRRQVSCLALCSAEPGTSLCSTTGEGIKMQEPKTFRYWCEGRETIETNNNLASAPNQFTEDKKPQSYRAMLTKGQTNECKSTYYQEETSVDCTSSTYTSHSCKPTAFSLHLWSIAWIIPGLSTALIFAEAS